MIKKRLNTYGWAFVDQVLVSGMNFLTGLLLARFLGPSQFGQFTMAWVFVLLSASLQSALITAPMMNIGPKQLDEDNPKYYGSVFILQSLLGLIFFMVIFVGIEVSNVLKPAWGSARVIFALPFAAVFFQGQDFIRRYFFTIGKPFAAFISDLVSYSSQVVIILVLINQSYFDATVALWICGTTSLLGIGIAIPLLESFSFHVEDIKKIAKRHWIFAKWIVGSAALNWATGNTLLVAAAAILGATIIGYLRAAQNLFAVTNVLFLALNNALPRQAANHFLHGGTINLIRFLKNTLFLSVIPTIAVAIILLWSPDFWLNLVYGHQFTGYDYIFKWIAIGSLLASLTLPIMVGLGAIEFTQPIFWTSTITASISLAFSVPLVKVFGLHGVLFGLIINQVITAAILLYQLWKKLQLISINLTVANK